MAGNYALDAFDYADKLNILDKIFYRISENGILEQRVWVSVVLFFVLLSILSSLADKYLGKESKEDEFLLNGTTTSGRSILLMIVTFLLFGQIIGFIKPEKGAVANKLSESTKIENIYINYSN